MLCTHHWDIATPEHPKSRGVCRLCGDVQEFDNIYTKPERCGNSDIFRRERPLVGGRNDIGYAHRWLIKQNKVGKGGY